MSSNINPNNIDGTYPIAGQDNNSQGFRDNFTQTKVNFQYAASEITDLQNNVVLKSALTGGSVDNNLDGTLLYDATMQDFAATRVTLGSVAGTCTINYASGHYQTVTISSGITLAFTPNFPAATASISSRQGWVIVAVTALLETP